MLIHDVVALSIMQANLEVAVVNIINHLSPKNICLDIYGVSIIIVIIPIFLIIFDIIMI
jgi:hypothetical protein